MRWLFSVGMARESWIEKSYIRHYQIGGQSSNNSKCWCWPIFSHSTTKFSGQCDPQSSGLPPNESDVPNSQSDSYFEWYRSSFQRGDTEDASHHHLHRSYFCSYFCSYSVIQYQSAVGKGPKFIRTPRGTDGCCTLWAPSSKEKSTISCGIWTIGIVSAHDHHHHHHGRVNSNYDYLIIKLSNYDYLIMQWMSCKKAKAFIFSRSRGRTGEGLCDLWSDIWDFCINNHDMYYLRSLNYLWIIIFGLSLNYLWIISVGGGPKCHIFVEGRWWIS